MRKGRGGVLAKESESEMRVWKSAQGRKCGRQGRVFVKRERERDMEREIRIDRWSDRQSERETEIQ